MKIKKSTELVAFKKRRKYARDFSAFMQYIQNPFSASTFKLPANAPIYISSDQSSTNGDNLLTVNSTRELTVEGGPADKVFSVGYIEKDKELSTLSAGQISLYISNGLGKLFLIGVLSASGIGNWLLLQNGEDFLLQDGDNLLV